MQKDTSHTLAAAVATALGAGAAAFAPPVADAQQRTPGRYVSGDFHNHSTCSDGSISMQKLVEKSVGTGNSGWGLDWFVQAGHGGGGNRNCTLAEDPALGTPVYPFDPARGPSTTWENSGVVPKGNVSGTSPNRNMWRWQSLQEFQYPITEYLARYRNQPLFLGLESVVAGHEHSSMAVITGQMPSILDTLPLPTAPVQSVANPRPYAAVGNADALAMWEYCFDRADTDTSRGNQTGTNVGNNWDCSVPGSLNQSDPDWNAVGFKLVPRSGVGVGERGHRKTLEALRWMAAFHPEQSYYIPAHLERAGPFNPDGNNGFNVEHLRNFNNVAPRVAFGFETQPGHGASAERGEYRQARNTFPGNVRVDSVGGTTYGGTGIYGALVGGVWDALLGEGRNFWFFASSDWHNRGSFGPDDRRSTLDFHPGEYQRNYTLVRNGDDKLRPQTIVDGLRTGNTYVTSGQLLDRFAFVACASYPLAPRSSAAVEALALAAAVGKTAPEAAGCATMGEKLKLRPGGEVVVAIVARDPAGANFAPYSFANPSLAQVGIAQPINEPVLDHLDVIRGFVSGFRTPGAPDYAGAWPRNADWLRPDGTTADLSVVPAAAKNTSAAVIRTFSSANWTAVTGGDGTTYLRMSFRIPAVRASQYLRVRGTNLPAGVPFETDANGNPLADFYTNATEPRNLRIPCVVTGTNVPANGAPYPAGSAPIDGCPNHLPLVTNQAGIPGYPNGYTGRMVAYDVAAWADLWFYGNPIYVEVAGGTPVAGVL